MLHTERHNIIGNKHTYFDYPSANMFYKVMEKIEKTMSYKILQRLSKGGNLHIHTSSSWDAREMLEFLKNNFKYKQNVYVYQGETIPDPKNKKPLFINGQLLYLTDKKLISEFEKKYPNKKLVPISEINIEDEIKLITFSDSKIMSEVDYIWDEFSNVFARVYAILSVKEVYKKYYYHKFKTLYADNIKLLEDKNICMDLINENSSSTFSQEDCKATLKGIYMQLQTESITAQQTAEFKADLVQNMSIASIGNDLREKILR